MKNSNKILLGLLSLILLSFASAAFVLGTKLVPIEEVGFPDYQEPKKSYLDTILWEETMVQDTSFTIPSFKYLVTDLHVDFDVADSSAINIASTAINKNIDELVILNFSGDTLFLQKKYDRSFKSIFLNKSNKDRERDNRATISVTLSGQTLEFLRLLENSRVAIKSTRSSSLSQLTIYQNRHSECELFSDATQLTYKGTGRGTVFRGSGELQSLDAYFSSSYNGYFSGFELEADDVNIHIAENQRSSRIEVHAKEDLKVQMAKNCYLDVLYLGNPTVRKRETSWGRVIDANYLRKISQ